MHGETHEVFNQPAPLENYNVFASDRVLQHWVTVFGGDQNSTLLHGYGKLAGGELQQAGRLANKHKPELHTHDRFGYRIDLVEYHPAYHQLMQRAITHGFHSLPWTSDQQAKHVNRAALEYCHSQADPGSGCPLTMTFACIPAIQKQTDIAEQWLPKILSNQYDPANRPWFEKAGLTIGMAMTEKQGGSDVRANTTRATPMGPSGPGKAYELVGHKWFCSAPMCDAFLVLAQTDAGLSCFLMPRWRPDGNKNQLFFQRLKDKMGNCSNASAEVEYRGALGWLLGEEGRGVRTIIEMVALTRFDCMIGSAALMRQAIAQGIHHSSGRSVFGKNLHEQPLMQNVLSDLAIESEVSIALALRAAYALDHPSSESQRLYLRLATAIGKYWICKRTPQFTCEAMECIGGVGYVEENVLPLLYREAPVNAIWEGSGNVQCLDVLRAIQKEPLVLEAYIAELEQSTGSHKDFDHYLQSLKKELSRTEVMEYRARNLVERLAQAQQANLLLLHGDANMADTFVRSRLTNEGGNCYGTLVEGANVAAIIERARPVLDR